MNYSRCPDCHKKGVTIRFKSRGEDNIQCRYCGWSAFVTDPLDQIDKDSLRRHAAENANDPQADTYEVDP